MIVCDIDELPSVKHASVEPGGTSNELDTRILCPSRRSVLFATLPPHRVDMHVIYSLSSTLVYAHILSTYSHSIIKS